MFTFDLLLRPAKDGGKPFEPLLQVPVIQKPRSSNAIANDTLVKKLSTTITCPLFSMPWMTLRIAYTPTRVPASLSSDAPMYTIALEMYLWEGKH
jgi:hypothetical protein